VSTNICLADSVDGFPNEPGKEKELATLVGEAYVWNHYWFNDWGKDFDRVFRARKKEIIGVCSVDDVLNKQKGYSIFFDNLPGELSFYKDGSWWAMDVITDYKDERLLPTENKKEYFDSKAMHLESMKNLEVYFDKNIFGVLNFGKFGAEKKKFVKDVFLKKIFAEDMDSYRDIINRNSKNGILIKVGNFNFNYCVFYYYVEGLNYEDGVPYFGTVYFDPKTGKAIHNELIGGQVKPTIKKYKNAIKRIDQDGMIFKYVNGKFLDN
jgi:hypothetical protein